MRYSTAKRIISDLRDEGYESRWDMANIIWSHLYENGDAVDVSFIEMARFVDKFHNRFCHLILFREVPK